MTIIDAKDFPTALKLAEKEFKRKPKNFQEATHILCRALQILLISKNHKYGKQNINDLGEIGIFCRTYDKVSRLKKHYIDGVSLGDETSLDTWGDLSGYAMVALLKHHKDWYNLLIKED